MKTWGLNKYNEKHFCQYNEDGMIREILESLNIYDNGFVVDVGAWDGIYLSNVYHLIKNKNFKGILIESNQEKFVDLQNNMKDFNITCVNSFVSLENDNSLDEILQKNNCPKDFDLISIDIDGNDWWMWNSLKNFHPKIVVIEYNSNINSSCIMPYIHDYVHHNTIFYGATPPALELLGIYKNYDLVGMNGVNMFFVRKDLNKLSKINSNDCDWFMKWASNDERSMMKIDNIDEIKKINND
jgi:hypothetical protein